MTSLDNLTAALLDVRAYLSREAQTEEFRNEAAWESGSSREEHEALDALTRLDEALRELTAKAPQASTKAPQASTKAPQAAQKAAQTSDRTAQAADTAHAAQKKAAPRQTLAA